VAVHSSPTLAFGQNADVDTSAEALGGDVDCSEVLVQAAGRQRRARCWSGIRTGSISSWRPGESLSLPVANVNLVQVKGSAVNQVVNWIARG
jgi:hypothetical protein